jgi:hypothetical protein
MCANKDGKVEILTPPAGSVPGDLIEFPGYPRMFMIIYVVCKCIYVKYAHSHTHKHTHVYIYVYIHIYIHIHTRLCSN